MSAPATVGRLRRGRPATGFSLIELLVATAVAAVLLTAAWAWCWTLCGCCRAGAEGADAASTIAAVRRLTSTELTESLGLVSGAAVSCSATGVAFVVPTADAAGTELVTYGYDAARGVLWRKSPSSHLAESVTAFHVSYLDGRGRPLPLAAGAALATDQLALVRAVELTVVVRSGAGAERATWRVCPPCPA